MDHFYAVIMAGGGGTRLWPVSRIASPKQMLKLFGEKSLFQIAVERLSGLFSANQIFVVTIADQARKLQALVPSIPAENYLIEPMPRGTAAVVAMAAAALHKKDQDAVLAILTADHFISDVSQFQRILMAACDLANQGYLTTLGITPTHAETGYGYIESGAEIGEYRSARGYKIKRFVEKPDEVTARAFLENKSMAWNSGMFITRADVILDEFKLFMPELYQSIEDLSSLLGNDHSSKQFIDTWSSIKPQTIDYGIMEKTSHSAVIPAANLGWNDVGSWDSLFDVLEADENGNIILGAAHIALDTKDSLIVSTDLNSIVVTMGLKNIIVVKTSDAVLICPRGDSQRVKELVNYLKENHYTLFL
jgi:mannose-1-phosphate guanylyltransferase